MLLKSNAMLESTLTFIVLSFKDRRFLTRRANGVREDWDKCLQRRFGNESTSFVDEAYAAYNKIRVFRCCSGP